MPAHPFDLPQANPVTRFLLRKLTRLDALRALYDTRLQAPTPVRTTAELLAVVLKDLNSDLSFDNPQALGDVPHSGALIIVANHPLGGLEGMLLTQTLLRIRPDLKVLTNQLLLRIPEFNDVFVGVDVLNSNAQRANARGIRTISKHLASGGAVLIFPAGEVSKLTLPEWQLADPNWNALVGTLALKHQAACLPIRVHGRNDWLFYLAGWIHERLRTALLGRAMLAKRGVRIGARIGQVVPAAELARHADGEAATAYLRRCTDLLGLQASASRSPMAKVLRSRPVSALRRPWRLLSLVRRPE
jgi:putative hemolysin